MEYITSQSFKTVFIKGIYFIFVCFMQPVVTGCGAFLGASTSITNNLASPGAYPNNTRCIWLIEAPTEHRVQITITFKGENTNSQCPDYIEVRDGSVLSTLLLSTCSSTTSLIKLSTARWLWLFFKSDYNGANSGLTASYSAVYAGASINNISSPVAKCRSHEFDCSNKECISMSYKCDDYNDCGCTSGCDEDDCNGLDMTLGVMYAIGSCVALIVFVAICMGVYLFERKFHWAHIKKLESSAKLQNGRGK
ncbi:hypothetical protein SNE40_020120 [Patella caerulea]|uniref:CUB domain-containing protein n=1 Tax=Patella caerulea TaxID=87958 RepID=A0AAN8GDF9_PATCE